MFTYKYLGTAVPSYRTEDGYCEDLSLSQLENLSNVEDDNNFIEYCDLPFVEDLIGYATLSFELIHKVLYSVTKYNSNRELTQTEINELGKYTQGQWSDGVGEGFEQESCRYIDSLEFYISPWHMSQEIACEVKEI